MILKSSGWREPLHKYGVLPKKIRKGSNQEHLIRSPARLPLDPSPPSEAMCKTFTVPVRRKLIHQLMLQRLFHLVNERCQSPSHWVECTTLLSYWKHNKHVSKDKKNKPTGRCRGFYEIWILISSTIFYDLTNTSQLQRVCNHHHPLKSFHEYSTSHYVSTSFKLLSTAGCEFTT